MRKVGLGQAMTRGSSGNQAPEVASWLTWLILWTWVSDFKFYYCSQEFLGVIELVARHPTRVWICHFWMTQGVTKAPQSALENRPMGVPTLSAIWARPMNPTISTC